MCALAAKLRPDSDYVARNFIRPNDGASFNSSLTTLKSSGPAMTSPILIKATPQRRRNNMQRQKYRSSAGKESAFVGATESKPLTGVATGGAGARPIFGQ